MNDCRNVCVLESDAQCNVHGLKSLVLFRTVIQGIRKENEITNPTGRIPSMSREVGQRAILLSPGTSFWT